MYDLPFEWTVLLLRIVFIFLLYFFVFQVIRVISRELRVAAGAAARSEALPAVHGAILVADPGDSNLQRGEVYDLEPVTVIGRHPRATIVIDSTFVSSEHLQLNWEQDRWWVTDLRSTNGTFVNGSQIRVPTGLRPGDVIELGAIRLQLVP
ncbi:MAG TPA: FHA domain-containing protein [Thermomicrobiales bacterium]|nr:FHA domain-containing protein [Thermomicrobiales bacterium]